MIQDISEPLINDTFLMFKFDLLTTMVGAILGAFLAYMVSKGSLSYKEKLEENSLIRSLELGLAQELIENIKRTLKKGKNGEILDLELQSMMFHKAKSNFGLVNNHSLFGQISDIYIEFDIVNLGKGGDGGDARVSILNLFNTVFKYDLKEDEFLTKFKDYTEISELAKVFERETLFKKSK